MSDIIVHNDMRVGGSYHGNRPLHFSPHSITLRCDEDGVLYGKFSEIWAIYNDKFFMKHDNIEIKIKSIRGFNSKWLKKNSYHMQSRLPAAIRHLVYFKTDNSQFLFETYKNHETTFIQWIKNNQHK